MAEAVLAAAVSTGTAYATDVIAADLIVSTFFTNLAITATAQAFTRALSDNDQGFTAKAKGRSIMFRSSAAPHQVIYGEAVVSGPLIKVGSSGSDNRFLHLVIPLAGHEVEAIDEVYFNDKPASDWDQYNTTQQVRIRTLGIFIPCSVTLNNTLFSEDSPSALAEAINADPLFSAEAIESDRDGDFYYHIYISSATAGVSFTIQPSTGLDGTVKTLSHGDLVYRINKHLGTPDQLADPDLVAALPEWTSEHRGRGRAYLHIQFTLNEKAWPTGLPNVKAKVRGKNDIYDPRGPSTGYTNNWALCSQDYLRWKNGFNCDAAEIDNASLIASANNSDEQVEYQSGEFQNRYEINGAFLLNESPINVLTDLQSAGAGACVFQMGQWHIHSGAPTVAETVGLDHTDLRGSLKYQTRHKRQNLFNAVRGTFIDPENHYQQTDFPQVTNSIYESEDGNEQISQDIELPFTNNSFMAQRLAKIRLEDHRQSITVEFPAKIKGLRYANWDVIPLTITHLGWVAKQFRAINWQMQGIGGPDLVLKEYSTTIYDWNFGEATLVDPAPNSTLADPRDVIAPSAPELFSGNSELLQGSDGTVISRIRADWNTNDAYRQTDEVEYKKSGDVVWQSAGATRNQELLYGPVDDGVDYDVRVRTVNTLGVPSAWATTINYTVFGKGALPPNASAVSFQTIAGGMRRIAATAAFPVDFDGYLIRARAGNTYTTWDQLSVANGGYDLHDDLVRTMPFETALIDIGTVTIGIKLVDQSGNESATAIIGSFAATAAPGDWSTIDGAGALADLDTVGTDEIDSDAVNQLITANQAGSLNLYPSWGPTNIVSATITTTGEPVRILCRAKGQGGSFEASNANARIHWHCRIRRGGSTIKSNQVLAAQNLYVQGTFVGFNFLDEHGEIAFTDYPAAGTHTYYLDLSVLYENCTIISFVGSISEGLIELNGVKR